MIPDPRRVHQLMCANPAVRDGTGSILDGYVLSICANPIRLISTRPNPPLLQTKFKPTRFLCQSDSTLLN